MKLASLIGLTILAFSSLCRANSQFVPPGPQVDVGYVSFVGNATSPTGEANGPVHFFGGIPYAQPPLGPLRFKAPQLLNENPPPDISQVPVLDARNWGPPCIQQPALVGVGSEGSSNHLTHFNLIYSYSRLSSFEHLEAQYGK